MEFKDYNHALIDTVQNSPYLYDPSNKHYKKGRSRVELWEEVSKKLQAMGYKTTGYYYYLINSDAMVSCILKYL